MNAAAELVKEKGAANLTLDAISEKANVSKGGLLYHFPSKKDIFRAMTERLIETLEQAREEEYKKLPPSAARPLKARVNALKYLWDKKKRPVAGAILAIGANSPDVLKEANEAHNSMLEDMHSTGIRPSLMRSVIFAAVGLHVTEMLGISALSEEERQAFFDELLQRVEREEQLLEE